MKNSGPNHAPGNPYNPLPGYLLAAGAAILWGVSGVVARYLIGGQLHQPAELLFFRTSLAALILIGWMAFRTRKIPTIRWRDLPLFLLLGGIGLVANQGFYYLSLTRVGVGYALLFQYLAPIMMMGYGLLTRTETMTGGKLLAAAMALIGCVMMVAGVSSISISGTLFALGSGIGFSFYAIIGKHLQRRYSIEVLMSYAFLIAASMWALINLVWPVWAFPSGGYDRSTWLFFIYLATVATVIPFGLFLMSLRYLEPSRSSLTSTIEPVVAAVVAWFWLGENLTITQVFGGAAVLGGVMILQLESMLRSKMRE
jgi:drug/metabolite transporter (DMT)-like permease